MDRLTMAPVIPEEAEHGFAGGWEPMSYIARQQSGRLQECTLGGPEHMFASTTPAWRENSRVRRLREAYTTSDFGFMADLIDRGFNTRYLSAGMFPETFTTIGYRRDTIDLARAGSEGAGREYELYQAREVPVVHEKASYLSEETSEAYYQFRTYKRGWQWDISWEAWLRSNRDLTGILGRVPASWGDAARYTEELTFTQAWGGSANVGVGNFFSAANGNWTDDAETRWYLFCDPALRPAVRYGYLQGYTAPEIFIKSSDALRMGNGPSDPFDGDFETDDIAFKLRFTWGVDQVDFRGAYCSEAALNIANLNTAINALRNLADPAGNVNPYMGRLYLVVPTSLEATAKNVINSTLLSDSGTGTPFQGNANPMSGAATVVVNYFLDTLA